MTGDCFWFKTGHARVRMMRSNMQHVSPYRYSTLAVMNEAAPEQIMATQSVDGRLAGLLIRHPFTQSDLERMQQMVLFDHLVGRDATRTSPAPSIASRVVR